MACKFNTSQLVQVMDTLETSSLTDYLTYELRNIKKFIFTRRNAPTIAKLRNIKKFIFTRRNAPTKLWQNKGKPFLKTSIILKMAVQKMANENMAADSINF